MEHLSRTIRYILAGAATVGVAACATEWWHKEDCKSAIITPAMKVTPRDCNNLMGVLRKYDTMLYKIQEYKKGKLVKTHGTLSDDALREGYASEVATEAKATKLTGCALQAGFGNSSTHPKSVRNSTTHPKLCETSEELVERLQPILAKYNKP